MFASQVTLRQFLSFWASAASSVNRGIAVASRIICSSWLAAGNSRLFKILKCLEESWKSRQDSLTQVTLDLAMAFALGQWNSSRCDMWVASDVFTWVGSCHICLTFIAHPLLSTMAGFLYPSTLDIQDWKNSSLWEPS